MNDKQREKYILKELKATKEFKDIMKNLAKS